MRTHGAVTPALVAEIGAFAQDHRVTEQVFRALDRAKLDDYDILQMDEYTLDLVVSWGGRAWLVYDTT